MQESRHMQRPRNAVKTVPIRFRHDPNRMTEQNILHVIVQRLLFVIFLL